MKRAVGFLLLLGGLILFVWAGAAAVNGCLYPFLPFSVEIVSVPAPTAFGLIHSGISLLGLAAALVGGLLFGAPKSLAAQRYRQTTGHHLPLLHRGRICRLLRRTAVLVWLLAAGLVLYAAATRGMTSARFWLGRLLPALMVAAGLCVVGAVGGWRRCPRCGCRLFQAGRKPAKPPVWLSPDDDWPGDANRFCPTCGYRKD